MNNEIPKEKVDRSRLRLLAVLSAGAAGAGCTASNIKGDGKARVSHERFEGFESSGGGGGSDSGGGGGGSH